MNVMLLNMDHCGVVKLRPLGATLQETSGGMGPR